MKYLIFILLLMPLSCAGQLLGISGQLSKYDGDHKFQFNASAAFPYLNNFNKGSASTRWALCGGIDYLSGSSTISGLNIKPASFMITTSEIFEDTPFTAMIGADAGYNFNFNHGNDGVILTPHLYLDYKFIFLKAGYDYNTFEDEGQFFIRLGIGIGPGFIKMISRSKHFNVVR